jgi:hypothetical protein
LNVCCCTENLFFGGGGNTYYSLKTFYKNTLLKKR